MLLGKQIDGVWHTSVVVGGVEHFFGEQAGESTDCWGEEGKTEQPFVCEEWAGVMSYLRDPFGRLPYLQSAGDQGEGDMQHAAFYLPFEKPLSQSYAAPCPHHAL